MLQLYEIVKGPGQNVEIIVKEQLSDVVKYHIAENGENLTDKIILHATKVDNFEHTVFDPKFQPLGIASISEGPELVMSSIGSIDEFSNIITIKSNQTIELRDGTVIIFFPTRNNLKTCTKLLKNNFFRKSFRSESEICISK